MSRALLLSYSVYMVAPQGDSEQGYHQEIASTMLRGGFECVWGRSDFLIVALSLKLTR
jgi:hypothetical protein